MPYHYYAARLSLALLSGAFGTVQLAQAQRTPEVWGSVGTSFTQTSVQRNPAPSGFRPSGNPHLAAALGLLWPLSKRIGLCLDQRLTGISPTIKYQYGGRYIRGRSTSGMPPDALAQIGISLWWLDALRPGPRWTFDAGLGISYARSMGSSAGSFAMEGNGQGAPGIDAPLVRGTLQIPHRSTLMAGTAIRVQYELAGRQFVLLQLEYQRGLRPLAALRTQQLYYVDDHGIVQHGQLMVSTRGSYGTAQLGYGVRLGSSSHPITPLRTPRYSHPSLPSEEPLDEEDFLAPTD